MAKVIWNRRALSDLLRIYDYIAQDSAFYARYETEALYRSSERLEHFPELGRRLPDFPHLPHRELLVGNYRLIYRFNSKSHAVYIVAIVHGKRVKFNLP
ncbi:MAG: hypothetical protein A2901_07490 [Elusimicrobia bacterium RIFCSPLOWO2_01_FULL_54_10]|nr:MAG: hypothetical protein A2901_07490 [Elusimicrobia bacterium RIFCSPLOWO2_01_FULL_54_10]